MEFSAVQELYGKLPVRALLYFLNDNKMVDYIPDESGIAAFRERVFPVAIQPGRSGEYAE